jgi:hypothetical protein
MPYLDHVFEGSLLWPWFRYESQEVAFISSLVLLMYLILDATNWKLSFMPYFYSNIFYWNMRFNHIIELSVSKPIILNWSLNSKANDNIWLHLKLRNYSVDEYFFLFSTYLVEKEIFAKRKTSFNYSLHITYWFTLLDKH